ncbi:uncharacterized protein FOMMEDRAFT_167416 [Fomitiporia mediterranea MF3/22]|uniref:uncharacterized protein n=1 Tax=Fomitiporia mediterranea (strain MF3/22) TaxID=694068 RepID=UPI000440895D|nr:uncharacterized protein FOMMEDRAFT_167416 [Fomitiporia mediterranea MF3/22]EJD04176.1 hypothetical protein FOMMEDRAFT_167416 [Fomitiporia mediterranea MF3/22]
MSQTESDSEASVSVQDCDNTSDFCLGARFDSFLPDPVASNIESVQSFECINKAATALEALKHIVINDEIDINALEQHLGDILVFAEAVSRGRLHANLDAHGLGTVDPAFLCILLNIRKLIRKIASEPDHYQSDGTTVCLIDYFFASCMNLVTSVVSSRQGSGVHQSTTPSGFGTQNEEDNVLIACQLPQSWGHFPGLLQCGHASPASKRLALSILFFALVIRPDIGLCDPWNEAEIEPGLMIECLQGLLTEFMAQIQKLDLSGSDSLAHSLRTAYAMTIVFFASAETEIRRREGESPVMHFRPHTSASLLELVNFVLLPSSQQRSDFFIIAELDIAQAILLQWGNAIPWAWQKWDDPRTINFDAAVRLTGNWFCHLDKSLLSAIWEEILLPHKDTSYSQSTELAWFLRQTVKSDPRATLIALFHQIRDNPDSERSFDIADESNASRLHLAVLCLAEVIEGYSGLLNSADLALVAEQLVMLFVHLNGRTDGKGSGRIIRCLDALEPSITEGALASLHKNITFFSKLAGVIADASNILDNDATESFLHNPEVLLSVIILLHFISLFCKNGAVNCFPETAFNLLSDLVKFLCSYTGTPELSIALLNCLVHTSGQCRPSRGDTTVEKAMVGTGSDNPPVIPIARPLKTWDDEDAYNLALSMVGTNLDLAAAFASYVNLTIKKNTDPLLVLETWDYLRDVLLIIATGRLNDCVGLCSFPRVDLTLDDEPSVMEGRALEIVNATEKICNALETILKRSDISLVRLLIDSPWIITLRDSLTKPTATAASTGEASVIPDEPSACPSSDFGIEDRAHLDPRIIPICKRFLEKLASTRRHLHIITSPLISPTLDTLPLHSLLSDAASLSSGRCRLPHSSPPLSPRPPPVPCLPPIVRSMFMSSPFRGSHRRSRSHTSLSSPSSSPVARSDKHRPHAVYSRLLNDKLSGCADSTTADSPFSAAPAFTAQPPEKWDVEAWRRGKRARRDQESPSEDADMESCDEPMPGSPIAELQANSLSMSVPSTPLPRFPATSDAFQFFPPKSSSAARQASTTSDGHSSFFGSGNRNKHEDRLEQMHTDAFSDLRKTVSEAGEGFVRRMREFEAHRRARSSRVIAVVSRSDGSPGCQMPPYKRGRKRPSPLSVRQSNVQHANVGQNRGNGSGSEADDSDIEIRSSCASGSDDFRGWSPSKKRAVSLSALGYQDTVAVENPRSFPCPIPLLNRDRSSSPSPSTYSNSSSDEDEDITSSSGSVVDRSRHRHALRFRPKVPSLVKCSPPSLAFSFTASNNSSRMSIDTGVPSPVSLPSAVTNPLSSSPDQFKSMDTSNYGPAMATSPPAQRTSKCSDKTVAALSLALANGAGSVNDYNALREAQGVLSMESSENSKTDGSTRTIVPHISMRLISDGLILKEEIEEASCPFLTGPDCSLYAS